MKAEFDLAGHDAVVTGGGRGLGRTSAAGLAAHGARLVLAERTRATLEATAAELGAETECFTVGVSREADMIALHGAALARFGRVDVLVNNAGVNPIFKGVERTSLDERTHIVSTNLTGVFLCCKHIGGAAACPTTPPKTASNCSLKRLPSIGRRAACA